MRDDPGGEDIPRVPVEREVRAGVVADAAVGRGQNVLREAGAFVDADGIALGARVGLGGGIVRVGAAEDVYLAV